MGDSPAFALYKSARKKRRNHAQRGRKIGVCVCVCGPTSAIVPFSLRAAGARGRGGRIIEGMAAHCRDCGARVRAERDPVSDEELETYRIMSVVVDDLRRKRYCG